MLKRTKRSILTWFWAVKNRFLRLLWPFSFYFIKVHCFIQTFACAYSHKHQLYLKSLEILKYLIISKLQKGCHGVSTRRKYKYQWCTRVTIRKCFWQIKWRWLNKWTSQVINDKILHHWYYLKKKGKIELKCHIFV